MVKDIMNDEEKFKGRRKYFSSRGLKRPDEIKEKEEVEDFLSDLPIDYLRTEREFGNDYNRVRLRKYIMAK